MSTRQERTEGTRSMNGSSALNRWRRVCVQDHRGHPRCRGRCDRPYGQRTRLSGCQSGDAASTPTPAATGPSRLYRRRVNTAHPRQRGPASLIAPNSRSREIFARSASSPSRARTFDQIVRILIILDRSRLARFGVRGERRGNPSQTPAHPHDTPAARIPQLWDDTYRIIEVTRSAAAQPD